MKRVIITGARGFIGSQLTTAFARHGWNVTALSRNPSTDSNNENISHAPYALGEDFAHEGDVLIHCAHDGSTALPANFNVGANARLFDQARKAGISKIVFISSLSASADAHSGYGTQKYLTEQLLDFSRDLAIRPGLVVGDGGLYAAIRGSLKRLRIAPIFDGGRQPVYVVAIDDLCATILHMVESNASGLFTIAAPDAVLLRDLYQRIAQVDGLRIYLVRLPYAAMLSIASLCERFGLRLPISAESIRGIRNLKYLDVGEYPQLGIAPMSATSAIASLGTRIV